MLKERDWLWGRGILFVLLLRQGLTVQILELELTVLELVLILPFFPECWDYSTGCTVFKTLEKNVEHLGGDRSDSGEPLRGSDVNRLGWRYTENLVSFHFNWSSNSWGHCNPKEVDAGRLGGHGYPQLYSRFQANLDYMRPWDLFLKKKAWIFVFNLVFQMAYIKVQMWEKTVQEKIDLTLDVWSYLLQISSSLKL